MFLVSDDRLARNRKIRMLLRSDPAIAVLVAAADFEWSCRRSILTLGSSPTKQMREKDGALFRCASLKSYKDAWKREVTPRIAATLPQVVSQWDYFKGKAFPLRHQLIHGISGTTGVEFGKRAVESILQASNDLAEFSESQGEPIFGRRLVRRKPRSSKESRLYL